MSQPARWQFSLRTIGLLGLVIGPLTGALAGTFGAPLQEVLFTMLVVFTVSLGVGILSTVFAFIALLPLFFIEKFFRRPPR
jgi:hypothetical protein